jgi:DNA-nicking Smr family endonuclease
VAKRKKHEHDRDETPAPPSVGTSLKGLLKGLDLSKKPEAGQAPRASAKSSGAPAKPSGAPAKPSGAPAKPSGQPVKPSGQPAKPSAAPQAASDPRPETTLVRPSDRLRGDDRIAFYDAIAGVRGLGQARPQRAVPIKTAPAVRVPRESLDAPARRKLGELLAGAHRFDVAVEEDGFVEGLRTDAPIEALGALRVKDPRVDATLDLHGLREADVEDRCARWIREQHRKGARRVLVVHGKGLHSPDGIAVLRQAVHRVLEASIATPLVLAFASAPPALGGTGATLVELSRERGRG